MTTQRLTLLVKTAVLALLLPCIAGAQAPFPSAAPPHAQGQPAPAQVSYRAGLLTVQARNASLNDVLLQATRAMGMNLTGTAREERIFGTFGPGLPAKVLADLLQGTATNMMLMPGSATRPAELSLTPQTTSASTESPETPQPGAAPPTPQAPPPAPQTPPNTPSQGDGVPAADAAAPLPQPPPLTPAERALLIDRVQRQQRTAAAANAQTH